MAERKRIIYAYRDTEAYERCASDVEKIVREDTGEEDWPILPNTFPPRGLTPPMSDAAIEEIKSLDDDIYIDEMED